MPGLMRALQLHPDREAKVVGTEAGGPRGFVGKRTNENLDSGYQQWPQKGTNRSSNRLL